MAEKAKNNQHGETKGPNAKGRDEVMTTVVFERLDRLKLDDNKDDNGERHANDNVVNGNPETGDTEGKEKEVQEVNVKDVIANLSSQLHLQAKG